MAGIPAQFIAIGNRLIHGLPFKVIAEGFLSGTKAGDLVTFEQVGITATSNLYMQNTEFPAGLTATVPAGYHAIAFGEYTINGELTVNGEFRIVDWPA